MYLNEIRLIVTEELASQLVDVIHTGEPDD